MDSACFFFRPLLPCRWEDEPLCSLLMPSTTSAAHANATSARWIVGVLIVVVLVSVSGWVFLRQSRARREAAMVERERSTAAHAAGENAVAARALANYLARLRAQVREHEAAFSRLQQQKALSWHIRERAEIERDRKIIRDFFTTNARLADTLQNGEGFIRAELNTAKVPAATRDSLLTRYAKSEGPLLPLQMHVRHCDQVIGENALAVLDLLDFNWGEWSRDEATGRIDFTNTITLATFKDYVGKIEAAAAERKQAEDELTSYQRSHPTP
jgi:hypothetical protein